MLIHITDSKEAKQFFEDRGIYMMENSSHNAITLKDKTTGKELQLWAESDYSIAAGIPGIFIEAEGDQS